MPAARHRRIAIAAAAATLALAGCAPDANEERRLGTEVAAQYDARLPIVRDAQLAGWLQGLGDSLVRVAHPDGPDYRFTLVNSTDVNAFALPGGFIYVNRGLVERVGSRDELAGVLAHEIAHVVHRHGVDQMVKRQRTGIGMTIVCLVVDICSSGLAQVAIEVGGNALFAKYGREDEREADTEAVGTLARAGMDPRAVPSMLRQLQRAEGRDPSLVDAFLGSHPLTAERVERTTAQADSVVRSGGARLGAGDSVARGGRALERGVRDEADAGFARFVARVRTLPAPPAGPQRRGGS
jgi:predicted Zn-dependent protease